MMLHCFVKEKLSLIKICVRLKGQFYRLYKDFLNSPPQLNITFFLIIDPQDHSMYMLHSPPLTSDISRDNGSHSGGLCLKAVK